MMAAIFLGEKGQAISIDAIMAITIFMVILAAIVTVWENQNTGEEKELILQDMKANGERTLNFLVRSAGEQGSGADWSAGGWSYRKKITISHANADNDLTNFPLYVKITNDTNIGAKARPDGYDLRFTSSDGTTLLKYERESFSISSGQANANIWVNVPTISGSSDTEIYLYYGKADATDGADPANVWDSNFKGVWHLPNGTTLSANDSTSNANNGIIIGAVAGTGKIGGAGSFNGSTNYILALDSPSLSITGTGIMLEAWIKPNLGAGAGDIIHKDSHYSIFWRSTGAITYADSITWDYATIGDYGNAPAGQWNHVAVNFNGSTIKFYVNGNNIGNKTRSGSLTDNANNLFFGVYNGSSGFFNGLIDEVRISNAARSPEWIKFEYSNMNSSNNDLTFGNAATLVDSNFLITGWETTIDSTCSNMGSLKFVGLAKRDRVIKPEKIAAFAKCADWAQSQSKYEQMKAKILLNYDYYFRFLDKSGNIIEEPLGTKMVSGKNPNTTSPYAIIILKRAVNYESTNYNGEAIAELQIFKTK